MKTFEIKSANRYPKERYSITLFVLITAYVFISALVLATTVAIAYPWMALFGLSGLLAFLLLLYQYPSINYGGYLNKMKTLNLDFNRRMKMPKHDINKEYQSLFEKNPLPLMVMELDSFKYLSVNEAALKLYGYSREEFLSMSALDIRPASEAEKFVQLSRNGLASYPTSRGVWKHLKKDGTIIDVKVSSSNITYNNRPARLVLVNDITEKIKVKHELRKILARFVQAQAVAHVGSWEVNFATGESLWSEEACRIYGLSPTENIQTFESWISFIHPDDLEFVRKEINKSQATLSTASIEHRIVRKDGEVRHINSIATYEFKPDGSPQGLFGVCFDITERKLAEYAKAEMEERMRTFIHESLLAIYFVDPDTKKITYANSAFQNLLGYTAEELYSMQVYDFVNHPRENVDVRMSEVLRMKKAEVGEREWIRKDGQVVYVLVSSFYQKANGSGSIYVAAQNITDRKVSEANLVKSERQLRHFVRHVTRVQEDERARIAREIHDELGQQLVGIKLAMSAFARRHGYGDGKEISVNAMLKETESALESLKRIATELRPGILDSLGLLSSVRWLAEEFQKKSGLKCRIEIGAEKEKYEKNISISFFRICQESLTNIVKHSRATEVVIQMWHSANILSMQISDNGIGIDLSELGNPFSMGLLGMRERAHIIGAHIDIKSKKGAGTTIGVKVDV